MYESESFRHIRGQWRASLKSGSDWFDVRGASGLYTEPGLVEWASITKGVVAAVASLSTDTSRVVRDILPHYPAADYTIGQLIAHTSGLPRLPTRLGRGLLRDPYGPTVGRPLPPSDTVPTMPRGEFLYSNLGYALLGQALDRIHTDWFLAARALVFEPAGMQTASLSPAPPERVLPLTWCGRQVSPWNTVGSPYAAAAGLWSTFSDICRYAEWSMANARRMAAWQGEGATRWINGQVRSSGVAIVSNSGTTAVVHVLDKAPHAADRIATSILRA